MNKKRLFVILLLFAILSLAVVKTLIFDSNKHARLINRYEGIHVGMKTSKMIDLVNSNYRIVGHIKKSNDIATLTVYSDGEPQHDIRHVIKVASSQEIWDAFNFGFTYPKKEIQDEALIFVDPSKIRTNLIYVYYKSEAEVSEVYCGAS